MSLFKLINYSESDWLDFKWEWHENIANLILDILCLANSDADNDRYIVFGVNDKDHSNMATPETNRKTLDQLNDLLGKAQFVENYQGTHTLLFQVFYLLFFYLCSLYDENEQ